MKKILLLLACAATIAANAQVANTDLVAHYSFDSTMAGTNGHTLPGTANYVADRNSNANRAHNIGSSTMSNAGIPNLPTGNNARSVAFWYKSNSNTTHSLFNYGAQTDYFGIVYDNGASQILVSDGGSGLTYAVSRPYSGIWTHVVVTYQSPTTSIYINGTLAGSTTTLTFNTSASPSKLGVSPFGGQFGNYQIDDLLIYGRALTAGEVSVLYNNTCPSVTTLPANLNVCQGASVALSVTGTGITWYDDQGIVGTGNTFTTPAITQTTSYLAAASSSCTVDVIVTAQPSPVGNITLSNDTIKSTNKLFETYVLKKDGSTVASGNSGGAFIYPAATCGTYQAEFTNTTNSCPNRSSSLSFNSGTCQQTVNITSLPTPAFFSVGFGVEPGEPTTAMNGTQLTFVRCQNALVIVKVRDANGCLYRVQWTLTAFPSFVTFTSSSDTATTCTIFSNTVTIAPTAPTNTTTTQNQTTCVGLSALLSATGTGTLQWFNVPTGGTLLGTGSPFVTPSLNKDSIFYVQSLNGGCASARVAIPVTVLSAPATPSSNTPVANLTVCQGSGTTLSVTNPGAGFQVNWWNVPTGTNTPNLLGSGTSINIPASSLTANATFYADVQNLSTGCVSATRLPVAVTVVALPAVPTNTTPGANLSICSGNSTSLSVTGSDTLKWYNAEIGGSLVNTGTSFTTPVLQVGTAYWVSAKSGNCSSARTQIFVQVNGAPNPPTNTTPTANLTRCTGQTTTLSASTTAVANIVWYNVATGGSSIFTGTSFTTPALTADTTYYAVVRFASTGCESTRLPIAITVNANPTAAISPATVTICEGASATLTASGGGTYAWSNTLGSGAAKTVSPTTSTTYTVTVTSANNCTATASRLVTVNTNPTAAITPATLAICNGTSATLTASGGGTYAWSNSGGSNAQATFSPTTNTTYTVTVTAANTCTATASKLVTVNTVNAAINGPTTICSGLTATLTASGGTSYAWSNSGGSNAAATFTPTQTTTYTVTVTGAGNCTDTASQTVSVQSAPTATITGNNSVCAGSSVTLTANGGNTYTWANALGGNAAITVSPTQTTTYTVTVSIGANCTASATQTVTVKQPSASTQNQTICTGKTVLFNGQTLSQNGSYKDTIPNAVGCDSIITLNLTVTPALQSSFSETVCNGDTYTFNNQTLTQGGIFKDTLQTSGGCDSIITLNLTVLNKIENTINASICTGQSYTFKGQTLTQNGQYLDTLQTVLGCDSFITLNLAVNSFVTGSVSAEICQGLTYTFNGQTLTQDGQYNDTLTSVGGCDSIVTLTLTVNTLPQPTIIQNGNVLSTQTFDNYQWQLAGSDINNATTQSHTALANGNYTVLVTDANGCQAFSPVFNVTGVGIDDLRFTDLRFTIYPNPTNDVLNISCIEEIQSIQVADITGRIVINQIDLTTRNLKLETSELSESPYFLRLTTTNGKTAVKSFVKQ